MKFMKVPGLLLVLLAVLPGNNIHAQDAAESADETGAPVQSSDDDASSEAVAPAAAEARDESKDEGGEVLETDDESYLDIETDEFKPSEVIPTDQSIAFPTDI
ncbi:MAG TPA: hypothetical protein PKK10_17205 [Woeseiaceae bacterium]|nr:hypothetical protein [Woeseiaceae bacterium]